MLAPRPELTGHEPSPPGLEEILRRNLEGELHRLQLERGMMIASKWTLNHRLGSGGFGQVWEAWHVELQRKHAIKFLDGQHRDPVAVRARFLAEAQLLARLESEHLVRVVDYGELPEEVPYFVMELVQGPTLRQRMSEPLSVPRAVEIAEQLLEALHDVHARGLTHGDIKPENIILSGPEEKVRVLDFGLAQITVLATSNYAPHDLLPNPIWQWMSVSEPLLCRQISSTTCKDCAAPVAELDIYITSVRITPSCRRTLSRRRMGVPSCIR